MTDTILITAIEESTGKTAIALGLGLLAKDRGRRVGYMKPKGTRLASAVGKTLDEDPLLALDLLDIDADVATMEPVVYSQMFVEQAIRGLESPDELRERIKESYGKLATDRDLMIIEGGGSLETGGIVDLTDPEVAELLDAEVILVATYTTPRDADEILAAADRIGERLRGVIFNAVSDAAFDELETEVVPFLERRDIPVLGTIPRDQRLAGVEVDVLGSELGAEFLTDAPGDAMVERFLVGAMGADSALRHFRRTKGAIVITGGDRSEIQTVALEAPGVECLVLTGGVRPSGAVVGKAEERGVPILLVQTDTLATIDRVEEILREGRTRETRTVDRMRTLLADHADVDAALTARVD